MPGFLMSLAIGAQLPVIRAISGSSFGVQPLGEQGRVDQDQAGDVVRAHLGQPGGQGAAHRQAGDEDAVAVGGEGVEGLARPPSSTGRGC